jgi:hypothetical protein
MGLTAMFSGLYSVLFAFYKPIEDKFEHRLQLLTLMASSVNFTIGMLMRIPKHEISSGVNEEGEELTITILLVATNTSVIIIIAGTYTIVNIIRLHDNCFIISPNRAN